ncbi:MAG: hypothetical protein EBR82_37135 [Caulobacteraceae bacterium]|nr:hypothetical protein [Caulobacteraceae bacterium]
MLETSGFGLFHIFTIVDTSIHIYILAKFKRQSSIINMGIGPHGRQTTTTGKNTLTSPQYIIDILIIKFAILEKVATLVPANIFIFLDSIYKHRTNTVFFRDKILHTSGTHTGIDIFQVLSIATITEKITIGRTSIANRATNNYAVFLAQLIITICSFHLFSPCLSILH